MKKFFSTLFFLFIITFGLLFVFRADIASHYLSRELGFAVRLEQFNPSPWGLEIKGAVIHNPDIQTTLKIDRLSLVTPFLSIFDKKVIIDKLELENVTVISKPEKINLNSLDSFLKAADFFSQKSSKIEKASKNGKQFVVKNVSATNIDVEIGNPIGKGTLVKSTIPSIKLTNLNQGAPLSLKSLIKTLSNAFLQSDHFDKNKG